MHQSRLTSNSYKHEPLFEVHLPVRVLIPFSFFFNWKDLKFLFGSMFDLSVFNNGSRFVQLAQSAQNRDMQKAEYLHVFEVYQLVGYNSNFCLL